MSRRCHRSTALGCLLVLVQIGCAADSSPETNPRGDIRIVDDAGSEITLTTVPTRILSLVPSATEILVALGQADRLVGRTDYDTDPELAHLPSVGGGLGPSMERVVALEPDVVVRFRAESDPTTPRQLDARGIPHLAVRPDRVDDIRRIIGLLGSLSGEQTRADSLIDVMDRELEAVSEQVQGTLPLRIAFLGGDPPTVAGPDTFLHELVEVAGGVNAFADIRELYAVISLEEILRRDVDLILAPEATPIPSSLGRIEVRRVPLEVLTPGLRVAGSARVLAKLLHPDRFR